MILKNKYTIILLHIGFWLAFTSLPLLIVPHNLGRPGSLPPLPSFPKENTSVLFWFQFVFIIFFYFNSDFLIPQFLRKSKLVLYWISILGCIAVIFGGFYLINRYVFLWPHNHPPRLPVFHLLFIFGLSCGYRYYIDRTKDEQLRKEKDFENVKTELYFLRSQISPHFIFNVLNSMVSLSRKRSDLMEPILIKLSELMRYMLYETFHTVQLRTEISYIQSYIDLQTMRFGDKVPVGFEVSGSMDSFEIEPMLLIPLVENAFKHGVGLIINPAIQISAEVNNSGELKFRVRNRYMSGQEQSKESNPGIGLKNLQRRLNLLYQDRYELTLEKEEEWYDATLLLKL